MKKIFQTSLVFVLTLGAIASCTPGDKYILQSQGFDDVSSNTLNFSNNCVEEYLTLASASSDSISGTDIYPSLSESAGQCLIINNGKRLNYRFELLDISQEGAVKGALNSIDGASGDKCELIIRTLLSVCPSITTARFFVKAR